MDESQHPVYRSYYDELKHRFKRMKEAIAKVRFDEGFDDPFNLIYPVEKPNDTGEVEGIGDS